MKHTLCWDCMKATGGCSWSNYWEHTPVEGWKAEPRRLRLDSRGGECMTYVIAECPEFVRDAFDGGTRRVVNRSADAKEEKWIGSSWRGSAR